MPADTGPPERGAPYQRAPLVGAITRLVGGLRRRGFNLVEVLLTAVAFTVLRRLGILSGTPVWVYLVLLVGGSMVGAFVTSQTDASNLTSRRLYVQVGINTMATTSVIYATGWGPTLAIGYMFVATDCIDRWGSRATRPVLFWSTVGIFLGDVAIALHLAPSRFGAPAVHGLATLAGLGSAFAIFNMGRATFQKESAEAEFRRSEDRFRSLVHNASDVVAVVDASGRLGYISPAIRSLGLDADDLLRTADLVSLLHPDDIGRSRATFAEVLGRPEGEVRRLEMRLRHGDGSWRWHEVNYTNLCANPSVEGIVVNFHDITERRAYEDRLAHESRHDPLTGLANRKSFLERLSQALSRARRQGSGVAVIFVDLDRFKLINDSLGHNLGDQLLVEVARRMPECLRPEDTVFRLSGDEFTILLEDVTSTRDAVHTAERLAERFRRPVSVSSGELVVTASVGVAVTLQGDETAENLLCHADLAMYAAKEGGRARAVLFDEMATPQFVDRIELEAGLRSAIERDELQLHYQPIVALPAGAVTGYEALLRWEHPARGLLAPGQFIGLAEDTGLIIPIGRWVIGEACRTLAALRAGDRSCELTMSVNVSAVQLHQSDFAAIVLEALRDAGLPPGTLVLEITESVLVRAEQTAEALRQLHAAGVQIALDDFGTGYSSLAYLRRLPLDFLKIDRSFVADLEGHGADTAIVRAIVDLAHTLGLMTIGEGVETEEQAATLTALGCAQAQGYLFGRPAPLPAGGLSVLYFEEISPVRGV